ncbi:hypothetical protein [Insolitispirillum peregrinum]|uniref:Uncharacterized protein n=1 Tax=Insolitispirillum peregrinum TaxID=80876 RepID=A0A1N7IRM3_9PROT|nr:hypothetical protein [Insolitispirillum peregrinum]SIS39744.1 hypothetical protein SAMN05421779_101531 [Insolitispirillum peregrinum]
MSGSNTIISIPGGGCCPQPPDLESAVRRVADQMHRLNHAIVQAVEAGATIELLRCSRHHAGNGRWGDQMQPIVTVTEQRPA